MKQALTSDENQPFAATAALWSEHGIFYTALRHPSVAVPIRVALHGINDARSAREAVHMLDGGSCLGAEFGI